MLVMTHAEADIVRAATTRDLLWTVAPTGKVGLLNPDGSPCCPLLGANGLCTIYAARPTNCRRFMCLREPGETLEPGGPMGCKNAERKVFGDRQLMRFYKLNQRRVMAKWGLKHGWVDDDAE